MARPVIYDEKAILRMAAKLFLEDGVSASTVKIAEKAGVSEAWLFKRYKTKEALFEAAMHLDFLEHPWRETLLKQVGRGDPRLNLEKALLALLGRFEVVIPRMVALRGKGHHNREITEEEPPIQDAKVIGKYLSEESRIRGWKMGYPEIHGHHIVGAIAHYVFLSRGNEKIMGKKGPYVRQLVKAHLSCCRALILAAFVLAAQAQAPRAGAADFQAQAPAETLTWMQCVRETTINNPGIQSAWKTLQNQDALRKGAYSALFPQLTATADASRSYNPQTLTSGSTIVTGGSDDLVGTSFGGSSSQSSYSSSYSVGLSLQQQIFDGFLTKGNIHQAKAQAQVALAQLLTEKSSVSYELKSAFAQLLYAQELIGISKSIVKQRTLNYRLVALKYDIGRENKGAVLLSKANLAQAEQTLKQAYRTLEVSQRQLLTAMGRTQFKPVVAQGSLVTYQVPAAPKFEALAVKTPAHFQQAATVDASKAGITIARSEFYPKVNLTGSYSSNGNEPSAPDSWSGEISGTWSIFDGGKTYFNVKAARASLESDQFKLRQTDADTTQALAEDYSSYVNAVENVAVSAALLEAALLRARIAEAQYRNGLISFQDFETITNDSITRQQTELQTRRDAVLAEAQWEQSQGIGAIQ